MRQKTFIFANGKFHLFDEFKINILTAWEAVKYIPGCLQSDVFKRAVMCTGPFFTTRRSFTEPSPAQELHHHKKQCKIWHLKRYVYQLSTGMQITFTFMHLADAFIQSDLQLHSGYTFSSVHVFPGNRTHNLSLSRRNVLPLSHTGTTTLWIQLTQRQFLSYWFLIQMRKRCRWSETTQHEIFPIEASFLFPWTD